MNISQLFGALLPTSEYFQPIIRQFRLQINIAYQNITPIFVDNSYNPTYKRIPTSQQTDTNSVQSFNSLRNQELPFEKGVLLVG